MDGELVIVEGSVPTRISAEVSSAFTTPQPSMVTAADLSQLLFPGPSLWGRGRRRLVVGGRPRLGTPGRRGVGAAVRQVEETPVDEGVVDKRLQSRNKVSLQSTRKVGYGTPHVGAK